MGATTTLGKGAWPSVPPRGADVVAEPAKPKKPVAPAPAPTPIKRTAPKVYEAIRIEDLGLCDDPLPSGRAKPGSKYDEIFAGAVKTGKTIKTPGGAAATVSNLARTWLKRNGHHDMTTRSIGNYGDGLGRVWFIKAAPQPAASKKGRAA